VYGLGYGHAALMWGDTYKLIANNHFGEPWIGTSTDAGKVKNILFFSFLNPCKRRGPRFLRKIWWGCKDGVS